MDKLLPNNWPLLFRAVCHVQKMDIWFLIDESGSIGRRNFETSLQFVADLSAQFSISLNGVRAGFSVYSSSHTFYSRFNEHTSNSDFSQLVLSTPYNNGEWILLWKIFHSFNWIDAPVVLPYVKNCNRCSLGAIFQYLTGGTRTGAAIDEVATNGFRKCSGLRPLSEGASRVLIVLTDGRSFDSVVEPAENVRKCQFTCISAFVLKVFNDMPELEHVFFDASGDFSAVLYTVIQKLSQRMEMVYVELFRC